MLNLSSINTNTLEGRLLIAALTIMTTSESINFNGQPTQGTKLEPDNILGRINEFQAKLFKDADPLPDDSVEVTQKTFVGELETLLNRYSKENLSDTPDFILAKFLNSILNAHGESVKARDRWFGVDMWRNKSDKTNEETRSQQGDTTRQQHIPAPVPDAKDQIDNSKK